MNGKSDLPNKIYQQHILNNMKYEILGRPFNFLNFEIKKKARKLMQTINYWWKIRIKLDSRKYFDVLISSPRRAWPQVCSVLAILSLHSASRQKNDNSVSWPLKLLPFTHMSVVLDCSPSSPKSIEVWRVRLIIPSSIHSCMRFFSQFCVLIM